MQAAAVDPQRPVWRALALPLILIALAGVLVASVVWGGRVCGPIDTALGWSGCVRSLHVEGFTVDGLALTPDRAQVAVSGSPAGAEQDSLRLLRADDGRQIWSADAPHTTIQLQFSPDGRLLAAVSASGSAKLWQASDGRELHTFDSEGLRIAFAPDSSAVMLGTSVWDVQTGAQRGTFGEDEALAAGIPLPGWGPRSARSPDASLTAEAFQAEGEANTFIAGRGVPHVIEVRRAADRQVLHTFAPRLPDDVPDLAFSPDSAHLAAFYNQDGRLLVWRLSDGQLLRDVQLPEQITMLIWSHDGSMVVVSSGVGYQSTVSFFQVR